MATLEGHAMSRFFELSPDLLTVVGPEGTIEDVNPAWSATLGWSREELVGRASFEFVHEDDLERTRQVDTSKPGDHFENRYRCRDGSYRWLSWRWMACEKSGHIYAIARDVTAQKAESAKLRKLQELHSGIVENVPAGVLYLDERGVITFENTHSLRITGADGNEGRHRGWFQSIFELPSLQDHPEFLDKVARLLKGEPFVDHILDYTSLYGRSVTLEISGVPVWQKGDESDEQVVGAVLLAHDVTQRKLIEEERVRGLDRLREVERLKDMDVLKTRFLNATAHELCTPLTPIRLQLHLIQQSPTLDDAHRRSLTVVQRNFDRLDALVKELMDASKLHASRLGVTRLPIDAARVVHEATESFAPAAAERGVRLTCKATGPLGVLGDAQRLHQVMLNLLSNALKFTPDGGSIEVCARRERGAILMQVVDTGAGIPAEAISRLFQPFSQVHDSTRMPGGTGLGLYICKGIVELHGGRIRCHSGGLGHGTTMTVTIPAHEAES